MQRNLAMEVSCVEPFCRRATGRACRDRSGHRMKAPHAARYRVAYARIAQVREAVEREAAARAELEPYMRAVERLVAMQEGPE